MSTLPLRLNIWKSAFFLLIAGYCLYYAPFGINETDGGFLTGLAWQVKCGKMLYHDVIYVRPPLPVWLRTLELYLLPLDLSVIGERWIFYLKVGLYSWLAASILATGPRRYVLASMGFVVSVHSYPATAWHTVDGILFSVLGWWLILGGAGLWRVVLAGGAIFCAMMCKQSFYVMAPLFILVLLIWHSRRSALFGILTLLLCVAFFAVWLQMTDSLGPFLNMTSGSTTSRMALDHGLFDYFRIKAELFSTSLAMVTAMILLARNKRPVPNGNKAFLPLLLWFLWLAMIMGSYVYATLSNQDFTAPFAQTRLMFGCSVLFCIWSFKARHQSPEVLTRLIVLLAVSWCASISWGYSLPVLFFSPVIFVFMSVSDILWEHSRIPGRDKWIQTTSWMSLLALLVIFRVGYEFVYRDGRRQNMTEDMGVVFTPLNGIRSDKETAELYANLRLLSQKYGPHFKVLPAFPQANFLCQAYPPFQMDWVVRRENNGQDQVLYEQWNQLKPVLFIEKKYAAQIETDPELTFTRSCLHSGKIAEETAYFWVVMHP
jgi:hypothetical protein